MGKPHTAMEVCRELLGRLGDIDEKLVVRVVTRDPKTGNVIKAKHAPISYITSIGHMGVPAFEALAIEDTELVEVPIDMG